MLIILFAVKEAGGTSMQLRHHLKSKHKVVVERRVQSRDPERFKCKFLNCGRIFKQNGQLQDHINTHTGERPNVCDYCDKTFPSKGGKWDHMQHFHLGKKRKIRIFKPRRKTIKSHQELGV